MLTTQALCSAEYLDPLPTPCSRYLCKMLCNLWVGVILMQVGFSLVTQMVKNPPAMQETQVQSLGWKDHLGEGNGNPLQYSCLENAHGQRSLGGYRPWGHKESDTTEQLSLSPYLLSKTFFSSVQFSSVTQSCPTLCNPMNHST